ncbi:MAG: lysostaphin resistance A-like protein [Actinomycetota bacterium]
MIDQHKIACYPAPIRVAVFIGSLLGVWLPLAAPIYLVVKDGNLVSILTMVLLFGEFLFLLRWWGRNVYRQPHLLKSYGLGLTRSNGWELLTGLGIGVVLTFSLFGLQGWLGWVSWQNSQELWRAVAEGLAVSLGVGFAEELIFRGWLLEELQRDYQPQVSLWADATIFAVLHFIRPVSAIIKTWPQFPGLLILGLTLVWGKRSRRGRLGLPIGLHAGLVWGYYMIDVGQLVQYSGQVPDWITGVNRNPLAGVMGLLFLGFLAFWMRKFARVKNSETSPLLR